MIACLCSPLLFRIALASLSAAAMTIVDPTATATDDRPESTSPEANIDRLLHESWHNSDVKPTAECSPPEYVRRVYLDLIGRIPSPKELQSACNDFNRETLVDELLSRDEYARHMAEALDTLLMGRTNSYDKRLQHGWIKLFAVGFPRQPSLEPVGGRNPVGETFWGR